MTNRLIAPDHLNKVTRDAGRTASEYAIVAIPLDPDRPSAGYVGHYLILRSQVEEWQETYGACSYVPVEFEDYTEFFAFTRNKG